MGTDALYYIMDYSGHYYRTNKADQLVAATGEEDAAVFTFAQANSRICVGKKASFYCMIPIENDAEDRETLGESDLVDEAGEDTPEFCEEMGEDDLESCESAEEEDPEICEEVEVKKKGLDFKVKELVYKEVTDPVEKISGSYDLSEMDWEEYLTHFTYVVAGLQDYREELAKKHSEVEQKISDVLHYIELCETKDEDAADLIDLLRVCRENRREIKDELQRIEYFQNNLGTSANVAKAKQALKAVKKLEKRKYTPRKFGKLFKNSVSRDAHLTREDLLGAEKVCENENIYFDADFTSRKEKEEKTMTEERNYTPYDGKENDWHTFARQQAEFYKNAEQYIANLQMEIRDIDGKIEEILLETENANCNVAQGYKVFKRLKELRLERKNKAKELECLFALTDGIDCDALAERCHRGLEKIDSIVGETQQYTVVRETLAESGQEKLHVVGKIGDMVG